MTSRFRLMLVAGALTLTGCGDSFNAGAMKYVDSPTLAEKLKDKPDFQQKVRTGLATMFGEDPQKIVVPKGSGFYSGGIRLGSRIDEQGKVKYIDYKLATDPTGPSYPQAGGYALYREHCLHCHGVTGAGDGPTSTFLYPRPRDYRPGIFKFTSTPTGAKPTRSDLRKTINEGVHGTSMPAFSAMLNEYELEQVVDYVIFLSMRGETEIQLIDAAVTEDPLAPETVDELAQSVFNKWKQADSVVVNPPIPKPPASRESVLRGKAIFLSLNEGTKVDCTGCHGAQANGDGPIFIDQDTFNTIVFSGNPSDMPSRVNTLDKKQRELWDKSLDDWGNPIRPANLNVARYKGGRRPLDLYWRIAKGINGAKMPAHFPNLEAEKIWDLVNFVQQLPYEPDLLKGAKLPDTPPDTAPKVADR